MVLLSMIIFNKCVFLTLISVLPYEQLDLLTQQSQIKTKPKIQSMCAVDCKERQECPKQKNNCPNVRF